LLEDVLHIKILQPKIFIIDVRDKDGSIKPLFYETKDPTIPLRIQAKINYIKKMKEMKGNDRQKLNLGRSKK